MTYRNLTSEPHRRGRPMDPAKDHAILSAVLHKLIEDGYDTLTIEGAASLAGTSKATIYRRWPNKRAMVVAAVRAQQGPAHPEIDTGSLRGDLLALCHRLRRMLDQSERQVILALLQAAAEDPDLGDVLETSSGQTGARLPQEVLDRAIACGELRPGTPGYAFDEIVGACLVLRAITGAAIPDAYLEHLVDAVLLPVLAQAAEHGVPSIPALFAGSGSSEAAHAGCRT